ncbi:HAD family hydrolase [Actinomadura terrae]|uniref:HAD family hydrolase n=1 Tax=Actinomadura terrae TaxID=604353 RepID=UPI001FA7C4EE|nr:HAD family hydrolase [Actinomadura terrae]
MTVQYGVVWDFEGTLAERPGLWAGCMLEVLRAEEPDLRIGLADIAAHMHVGFPWHTPDRPHPHLCDPGAWWEAMNELLAGVLHRLGYPPERARPLAARTGERYMDASVSWRVFPEAVRALQRLKDHGYPQIILSNHAPELELLVEGLGLAPYFDAVITSALTGFEKPHENAYKLAREALPPGAHLWMAGDNEEADALGPERSGIQGIHLTRGAAPTRPRRARRHAADLLSAVDLMLSSSER